MNLNYFSLLCFTLAGFLLVLRFVILGISDNWREWELKKIHALKQSVWLYFAGVRYFSLAVLSWYMVHVSSIRYGWIAACLLTIFAMVVVYYTFRYEKFKELSQTIYDDARQRRRLNYSVLLLALVLFVLGIYYTCCAVW